MSFKLVTTYTAFRSLPGHQGLPGDLILNWLAKHFINVAYSNLVTVIVVPHSVKIVGSLRSGLSGMYISSFLHMLFIVLMSSIVLLFCLDNSRVPKVGVSILEKLKRWLFFFEYISRLIIASIGFIRTVWHKIIAELIVAIFGLCLLIWVFLPSVRIAILGTASHARYVTLIDIIDFANVANIIPDHSGIADVFTIACVSIGIFE